MQKVVRKLKSRVYHWLIALQFDCLVFYAEWALFQVARIFIKALFVFRSSLLKRLLLLLSKTLPSEGNSLHDLRRIEEQKSLFYDFSKFLAEVDIGWERLFCFVLRLLSKLCELRVLCNKRHLTLFLISFESLVRLFKGVACHFISWFPMFTYIVHLLMKSHAYAF